MGGDAQREPGVQRPGMNRMLDRQNGLQREADDAERERHTRWRMCGPRPAENGRGNRQDAEVSVGREVCRVPRRLVRNHLDYAWHG